MNIRAIAFTEKGQGWQEKLGFPVTRGVPVMQWAREAFADADALRAVPVGKELSTETIEMTTDVVVVGGVMGDDSPSGANNGWALTAGKLAAEAIAE